MRPAPAVAAAALAAVAAGAAVASAQTATTDSAQDLFARLIRSDPKTADAVRDALGDHRAFVDPEVGFTDLTGDGKQDAIVRVDTGGAAGAVAVYVLSSDGGKLHAIYRTQRLYRALVRTEGATLLVRTPAYAPGDEVCCPHAIFERTLTWSPRARRLVLRSTRTVT